MPRNRILSIGGGSAFASGGVTNNVVPKSNGAGQLADSSITDNGTTVSTTEPIVVPDTAGSGVPSLKGATAATGLYLNATTNGLVSTTANWIGLAGATLASGTQLPLNGSLGWSTSASIAAAGNGLTLRERAAANLQMGAADLNGAPVAQTISVQSAITGSNLAAAASFTVAGPLGTGTGTTGQVVVTGGDSSVATGTTAQTGIIRVVLNATKALTSGAATTLVSIPLATLQMTGGYISVYMEATDGTNQATRCEEIYYAGENSAGVFVTSTGVVGTGVTACTATKTLTATYALTGANPALLQVTPTLTGITATRFTCVYQVCHGGNTQPTV